MNDTTRLSVRDDVSNAPVSENQARNEHRESYGAFCNNNNMLNPFSPFISLTTDFDYYSCDDLKKKLAFEVAIQQYQLNIIRIIEALRADGTDDDSIIFSMTTIYSNYLTNFNDEILEQIINIFKYNERFFDQLHCRMLAVTQINILQKPAVWGANLNSATANAISRHMQSTRIASIKATDLILGKQSKNADIANSNVNFNNNNSAPNVPNDIITYSATYLAKSGIANSAQRPKTQTKSFWKENWKLIVATTFIALGILIPLTIALNFIPGIGQALSVAFGFGIFAGWKSGIILPALVGLLCLTAPTLGFKINDTRKNKNRLKTSKNKTNTSDSSDATQFDINHITKLESEYVKFKQHFESGTTTLAATYTHYDSNTPNLDDAISTKSEDYYQPNLDNEGNKGKLRLVKSRSNSDLTAEDEGITPSTDSTDTLSTDSTETENTDKLKTNSNDDLNDTCGSEDEEIFASWSYIDERARVERLW